MPRYSHDRADRFARVALAVAVTAVLGWAGLTFHLRDRESSEDRQAIHALLEDQGRRINALADISAERNVAARGNITLNESMAERLETIAIEQKRIRELIEAKP
jgi:hypothetical protein